MSQETEENYQEAHLSKYGLIVANHIGAMVAYWDTNLVCRFANKVYGEWFGRTPDEMIDKVTAKELLGSIFEKNLPYFKGALNGQVQTFERTLTISSGEVRHTLANYYPHFVKGEVKGVIVHVVDITQIKKLEIELMASLEREKALNEMKSRFVSLASHEFRTPLTAILSSISLIEHYPEAKEQGIRVKHIERIKSEVNNLTSILNDFLSVEKLEQGKIVTTPSQFNLKEFINDVIEKFQGLTKQGQVVHYNHEGDDKVVLDRQNLQNVLLNLISNAIKYSETDIEVSASVENKEVTISVTDKGIGIPEEEQKYIFTRFFRAKNATNIQGTGLGLNIVKRYIEIMGGTIGFTSNRNAGTTFVMHLPQKQKTIEREILEELRKPAVNPE